MLGKSFPEVLWSYSTCRKPEEPYFRIGCRRHPNKKQYQFVVLHNMVFVHHTCDGSCHLDKRHSQHHHLLVLWMASMKAVG